MTKTIEQFISWKDDGHGAIAAWFDQAAASEAGLVRRRAGQGACPCYAAEIIDTKFIPGKFHLVEDGATFDTLEEAKIAALESAIQYITEG